VGEPERAPTERARNPVLCPPTAPVPHSLAARTQTEDQQQALVREIFSLLSKRTDAVCNFLEGGR
jgi:hypothetical protein